MWTKTRLPKARLSKSPEKPPIVPNARFKNGSNNAETSMNRFELGNDNDDGDHGFEVFRNSFLGEECDFDGIDRDWLVNDTCVECYRTGELFVCSEVGCLMAYHEKCMNFKPNFDEKGKFYCPCCWFKRQRANLIRLKKKAMLAKKALLDFVDPKSFGEVQEKQNNVVSGENVLSEVSFDKEGNDADHSDRVKVDDGGHVEFFLLKEAHMRQTEIAKSANYDRVKSMVEDQVEPVTLNEEGAKDGVHDQLVPVEEVHSRQNESAKPASCDQTKAMFEDEVEPGTLHKEDTNKGVHDQFVPVDGVHPHKKESAELSNCDQTEAAVEDQVESGAQREESRHKEDANVGFFCKLNGVEVLEHDGGMKNEENEQVDDDLEEGSMEDEHQVTSHFGEGGIMTDASHGLMKDIPDSIESPQENQDQREEEEQTNKDVPEVTLLSTGNDSAPAEEGSAEKECKIPDSDTETVAVRRKRVKQICRRTTSKLRDSKSQKDVFPEPLATILNENKRNHDQKVNPSKEFRHPQESPKGFVNPQFANEKRKRMYWTSEEEDMLREGVHMYSTQVNKNIPWRKILDFGRGTFHSTRTPTDLRDKWRKIVSKES